MKKEVIPSDANRSLVDEDQFSTASSDDKGKEYRIVSAREVEIAIKNHVLWMNSVTENEGRQFVFKDCLLEGIDFTYSPLLNAVFDGSKLVNCQFEKAILCGASFKGCMMSHCTFQYADADEINFQEACFDDVDLSHICLWHGNFCRAEFSKCSVAGSRFHNSCFEHTAFKDTPLEDCDIDPAATTSEAQYLCNSDEMTM